MTPFDLNCDLGEGIGNDADLMPYLDSCSIACGGHAGDKESMAKTISLAQQHGVKIGAHPSFPDRENFGRKIMQIEGYSLVVSLIRQLNQFKQAAETAGATIHHVKMHGALYNLSLRSRTYATICLTAISYCELNHCFLYCPADSAIADRARIKSIPIKREAFIDRLYVSNGQLAERSLEGAVITDPLKAFAQFQTIRERNNTTTYDGSVIPLEADTYCLHGDNPKAFEIAKLLRQNCPA